MLKRLLRNLIIVTLLLFATPLSLAHAQTHKSESNYFTLVKSLVVQNANTTLTPTPYSTPLHQRSFLRRTPTLAPTLALQPTANPTDPMTFVMSEINAYRTSLGLSPVTTSTQTCNFASVRAKEIVTDFSHTGFQQRINTKTLPYTSWTKVTENLAMTSSYKQVVTLWKNSPGHAANMRENTPFVCVRQVGNYFAYEGMKP